MSVSGLLQIYIFYGRHDVAGMALGFIALIAGLILVAMGYDILKK
jgi:hypothetical protein